MFCCLFQDIAENVIRGLNEYGWAVVENFIGATHCRYTYAEVETLYERGLFHEGQLVDHPEPDGTGTRRVSSCTMCSNLRVQTSRRATRHLLAGSDRHIIFTKNKTEKK